MPLLSTKSLITTGLFILVPISIVYTFHSSAGSIDPLITTSAGTSGRASAVTSPELIYESGVQKRAEATNPGTPDGLATDDNWGGVRVSAKCSEDQQRRIQQGWLESGYLARAFKLSLEELKYERALGDYLGNSWKTNGFSQRITDNFGSIEALHSGGADLEETLDIHCDETEIPLVVLIACDNNSCCTGSPDGKEGGYFYVKQAAVPPASATYGIVLCPPYFRAVSLQERAGALLASKEEGIDEIKKNIWALYPNIGSILLHLQYSLIFKDPPRLA
ncbi:hypothetical protein TWF481_005265 [Arthrobotrys musiformis]|uniref:Uncharacterized protein n=1 Tax=Arthrobotrys musiformis TaxID=47236 RepID=A0AAV9WD63_9PEZI